MTKSKQKEDRSESKLAIQFTYIALMLLGILCITCSRLIDHLYGHQYDFWELVLNNLGTTILTIGLVTMFYELKLRKRFMNRISNEFEKIVEEKMPERYHRLTRSGIIDGFEELEFSKIRHYIQNAKKCEIIFYKMWISNLDAIEKALEHAVRCNGCTVRVLLLDPSCRETIETRASVLEGRTPEMIESQITSNIGILKGINDRLAQSKSEKRIEIKVHRSFVACSMIAIDSVISLGLYLNNLLSTQGIHIRFSGRTRTHPQALFAHFEKEWIAAQELE